MFELEPLWRNFFENDGTVQFIHRIVAYLLFIYVIIVWRRSCRSFGPNSYQAIRPNNQYGVES